MKLGFIGIGLMGRPMTLRLLAAGHQVTVWNRNRDKLAPVLEKGAKAAESPAAVARSGQMYWKTSPVTMRPKRIPITRLRTLSRSVSGA